MFIKLHGRRCLGLGGLLTPKDTYVDVTSNLLSHSTYIFLYLLPMDPIGTFEYRKVYTRSMAQLFRPYINPAVGEHL